ncbi:hypothetical protein Scep_026816 [Stephania cephalantha]|uniref:Uncharacterized protein n=1 Tax=Stephania cephalantha TaxID=152367 RepID=A0AAP0EP25_9MAGN
MDLKQVLGDLDKDSYIDILSNLIGEAKFIQNNPPELIPEEDRVGKHVMDVLVPYSTSIGGPLIINHVSYVKGRGNIIVEYPGSDEDKVVSFVGSHMNVVPANPYQWVCTQFVHLGYFDPFSLSIDGDKLHGRGTTDRLGHVALLTELMKGLAEKKPKLKSIVVVVFIVNAENSIISGFGVDQLLEDRYLDRLKQGPLYWIDTADKQPCIGNVGYKLYGTTDGSIQSDPVTVL